ncbi:MAG: class I SAM-dependent RNA methyltransferase [Candidatus Binatia bacterium]|nr:class I SAM-dependent RNA methyltransferase [Candidatus Binatia bacterium]
MVTVERMAYGPHGVAHLDGRTIFVRGAAPGDVVRVAIDEEHGSYAYAHVEEVLEPSPHRRIPPCPYLPRCGGCPWQHLQYDVQLAAKQANVRDHLQRLGKIAAPPLSAPIPSPAEFSYRNRLSLRVEQGQIGFYAGGSHELVPIERCLLGNEAVNSLLPEVASLVGRLHSRVRRVEVIADAFEPSGALALAVEGHWRAADDRQLLEWFGRTSSVRGVALRGKRWQRTHGNPRVTIVPAPGVSLEVTAGAFSQVNAMANQILVEMVSRLLAPDHRGVTVDAYAGAGNFSFPLAQQSGTVVAIEADPRAVRDFRANAERLHAENVELVHDTAERALKSIAERGILVARVVLDPPRSGARAVLPYLLHLRPERIVYVSCNSATLARDLAVLSGTYRLEQVQIVDLFPQTYHTETVALLVLTC